MNRTLAYRISLGLSILLTVVAFFALLGSVGTLINGWGRMPFWVLFPWAPVLLIAAAALNCTIRARVILKH
jgi:hypothetical protein